jgi:hypothetical protein
MDPSFSEEEPFLQTARGSLSVVQEKPTLYRVQFACDDEELLDKASALIEALQNLRDTKLFLPREVTRVGPRLIATYELEAKALPLTAVANEQEFLLAAARTAESVAALYGLDSALGIWVPHTRIDPALLFTGGQMLGLGLWQFGQWFDETVRGRAMLATRQSLSPDLQKNTARTASFFLAEALWRVIAESEPFPFNANQMFEEAKALREGVLKPFVANGRFPVSDKTADLLASVLRAPSESRSTPAEFSRMLREHADALVVEPNIPRANAEAKPWWKKLWGL